MFAHPHLHSLTDSTHPRASPIRLNISPMSGECLCSLSAAKPLCLMHATCKCYLSDAVRALVQHWKNNSWWISADFSPVLPTHFLQWNAVRPAYLIHRQVSVPSRHDYFQTTLTCIRDNPSLSAHACCVKLCSSLSSNTAARRRSIAVILLVPPSSLRI